MIYKSLFAQILLCFLLSSTFAFTQEIIIPAEAQNKLIGVRVSDVVASYPQLVPGLANFVEVLKKKPEDIFIQDKVEVVHDVFFNGLPQAQGGMIKLGLTAFVRYKKDVLQFEKLVVTYAPGAKNAKDFSVFTEYMLPLKETSFKYTVGLVDRKLILEDTDHEIKMVFPIGVGSFDEGVLNEGKISLLTPRFKNGLIDQRAVISKREKPRYFAGKPFIRILKGSDIRTDTTAIGFHIEINSGFVRGFDSHGCMRLREMDLMAFHDLIMFNDEQQAPISVSYHTADRADHPAGKRNGSFKTVLNKGTAENPFFIFDRDNLIQTVYKEGQAPFAKLFDYAQDDYYDLFNYDTIIQLNEQEGRRKNECDAKIMRGELEADNKKKYEQCLDEGKRKDTLKDKLYRKYMGIDEYVSELALE